MLTHNYETTTILYYTIFLPGVLVHEVIYWLAAGILNVRADRSIQWPEKQEIGNLQLNFIRLSNKAHPLKRAVIAASPLFVGLMIIWLIAINIFQLEVVISLAGTGRLEDIAEAISFMTSAPDFWLWFYISFTIANTMFPTIPKDMQGWWQIIGAIGIVLLTLFVSGIGQSLLSEISLTITQLITSLSLTLILTIIINIFMVLILGAIEYSIERVTGHSATFQKGKMITMTRAEALELKEQEQKKRQQARITAQRKGIVTDLSSIYALELPIPGPPSQEPVTKGVAAILGIEGENTPTKNAIEDEIIEGSASDSERQRMLKLFPERQKEQEPPQLTDQVSAPETRSSFKIQDFIQPAPTDQEDEKDESKNTLSSVDNEVTLDRPSSSIPEKTDDSKNQISTIMNKTKAVPEAEATTQESEKQENTNTEVELKTLKQDLNRHKAETDIPTTFKKQNPIELTEKETKPAEPSQPPSDEPTVTSKALSRFNISEFDIEDDDDESITGFSRPFAKPTEIEDSNDLEDPDTSQAKTRSSNTAEFARPFAKPVEKDLDDDDDEQLNARPKRSSSIFDSNTPNPKPASDWRNKFSNTTDSDDDDDDEQLNARPKRSSSIFDSNTPNPKPASDWRNKFSTTIDSDDDDDDEQLSARPKRSSSIFDSNTPNPKPASDWRNKFSTTTDSDDDDDDEQLSARPKRSSSIFDSNTPNPKPASDWRNKFSTTIDSDDDDDDEQLSARPKRASTILTGKNPDSLIPKKTDQSSTDWRSKFTTTDSEADNGDLTYEPIEDDLIYEDDSDFISYDEDEDED